MVSSSVPEPRGKSVEIRSSVITRKQFLTRLGAASAFLAVGGSTLVACGGSDEAQGNKITYWASNQGSSIDEDKKVLRGVAKRFEDQTGISMDFKVIPWPDLYNNILTATTSGEGPDVLNIGNTWSPALQATGAFLPIEGSDLEAVGGKDKFVQTAYSATGMRGEPPMSMPLYGLSYGLFYNKAMFEEAGIESPPKTWDEFVSTAKRLTKDTDGDGQTDQWGVAVEGASITENAHWAFILGWQHGGSLFDGNEPTFDSPEIVRAVKQYVDFIGEDQIAAPRMAEFSDGTQSPTAFANGEAAMIVYQKNAENNIKSAGMKEDEYGVAEVPVLDPLPSGGEPVMSHVAGINIAVFKNAANKEGALKFVNFMTGKDEQVQLNQDFNSLPVTREAAEDSAFGDEKVSTFQEILADHAEPMPLVPEEGKMETVVGDAIKQLFAQAATTGSVSESEVKAKLSAAQQKMGAGSGA